MAAGYAVNDDTFVPEGPRVWIAAMLGLKRAIEQEPNDAAA